MPPTQIGWASALVTHVPFLLIVGLTRPALRRVFGALAGGGDFAPLHVRDDVVDSAAGWWCSIYTSGARAVGSRSGASFSPGSRRSARPVAGYTAPQATRRWQTAGRQLADGRDRAVRCAM